MVCCDSTRLDLVKGSHTFSVPRVFIAKASPEYDVMLLNGGGNNGNWIL